MASESVLQLLTIFLSRAVVDHQVYDWLTLLDREVEHVWRSEWSMPKILFIISRYGTVLDMLILIAGEPDLVHRGSLGNADRNSAEL